MSEGSASSAMAAIAGVCELQAPRPKKPLLLSSDNIVRPVSSSPLSHLSDGTNDGERAMEEITTILHTAAIANGNSDVDIPKSHSAPLREKRERNKEALTSSELKTDSELRQFRSTTALGEFTRRVRDTAVAMAEGVGIYELADGTNSSAQSSTDAAVTKSDMMEERQTYSPSSSPVSRVSPLANDSSQCVERSSNDERSNIRTPELSDLGVERSQPIEVSSGSDLRSATSSLEAPSGAMWDNPVTPPQRAPNPIVLNSPFAARLKSKSKTHKPTANVVPSSVITHLHNASDAEQWMLHSSSF